MLERLKMFEGKTKKSKQGVVLVTILFILAVALIFIVSALMLTTATRTRLYTRAEDNQARLTVTSAAESFYQALYMQDITDEELMKLDNTTIRLIDESVPGMSAKDSKNCTYAYFKKNADNTMVIDFKTRIGDQVECIKMVLDYNEPTKPANNFAHMLNVSKGGVLNRLGIGMTTGSMGTGTSEWRYSASWLRNGTSDNTLIFRGWNENIGSTEEQNYFYSDVISTGPFSPIDSHFYGNLVFWGSTASYELKYVKGSPVQLEGGNVYFAGNTASITNGGTAVGTGNYGNCGEWFKGKGNVVFYDESAQTITFEKDQNHANNSTDLKFNKSSNTTLGGAAPTAVTTMTNSDTLYGKAKTFKSTDYTKTVVGTKEKNDLLTWSGIAKEYSWEPTLGDAKANVEKTVSTEMLTSGGSLGAGTYKISGTMGEGKKNPVITCDLKSGSYVFYITDNFTIESGYFEIINGAGSPNNVFFIIGTGKVFTIGVIGTDSLAGIVCTNCYSKTLEDKTKAFDFYRNYGNVNNNAVPHAYIYSMGTGGGAQEQLKFESNHNGVCNAFVGLYPTSSTGTKNDGTLYLNGGGSCMFYGRITCASVNCNGGSILAVPYCPQPGSDTDGKDPVEKYTDFRIYDYQYYTETPA